MQLNMSHNNPSWETMGDFQKYALSPELLGIKERRQFLRSKNFLISPKNQDVLRRQHSKLVDQILGFKIKEIEKKLIDQARAILPMGDYTVLGPKIHQGVQTWVGLDPETLQTPYSEILRILKILSPRDLETIVDLGAAYGRMGIVLAHLRHTAHFIGIEYSLERVDEGQRIFDELKLHHSQMIRANLFDLKFELPKAQYYFMYDYGYHAHIAQTLLHLSVMSKDQSFKLITRGTATLGMIERDYPHWEKIYQGKGEEQFSIFKVEE